MNIEFVFLKFGTKFESLAAGNFPDNFSHDHFFKNYT